MADNGVTMLGMARKSKAGRPKGRKPTYIVYARVDPKIGEALEAYIAQTEPRPSQTAAVELALKRLLAEAGLWPPPPVSPDS